jgi:hypothetical protein
MIGGSGWAVECDNGHMLFSGNDTEQEAVAAWDSAIGQRALDLLAEYETGKFWTPTKGDIFTASETVDMQADIKRRVWERKLVALLKEAGR